MQRKSIVFIGLLFCSASGMENDSLAREKSIARKKLEDAFQPIWHAPASGSAMVPVRADMLAAVVPARQCGMEGIIKTLIGRPFSGRRTKEKMLRLTKFGVEGDRRKFRAAGNSQLQAVSLMRSDVSDALGGAPVPGDDIHVSGLDIGDKSLACGGLIVIKDAEGRAIKAVLLKTAIEYYANERIVKRCGQLAADFLHAEGPYAGSEDYSVTPVHGVRDRLRGLKLAVLLEGEVAVGDRVYICNNDDADYVLKEYKLKKEYQWLVERSAGVAELIKKRYENQHFERFMASWRAQHNVCSGLSIKGLAVVSSVVSLLLLCSYYLG